jgi:hypothetical protein
VVEKYFLFPRLFVVASFTLLPLLAFVRIVLFVTTNAVSLEFFLIKDALMAVFTLYFPVFATQRIVRTPIMVEHDPLPVPRRVTGFTLFSPLALVTFLVVVTFVTCVTVRFQFHFVFVEGLLVAGSALRTSMFSF